MNIHTYKAILLSAADYREKDKLLTLFTLEAGIVRAVMKGVKNPGAKLKFGALPFAFCEYTLHQKGDFFTVTGCSQIENLFGLSQDFDRYAAGSILLELTGSAVREKSPELFVLLLKCLKHMLYTDTNAYLVATAYCQRLIHMSGYGYRYARPSGKMNTVMDILEATADTGIEQLSSQGMEPALIKKTLLKLVNNFQKKFGCTVRSAQIIE